MYTNSMINLWANISHKLNTDNESILSQEMFYYLSHSFYLFNFFDEGEKNDLNFDKFIKNYEIISHEFSQDVYKKFSNIGGSLSFMILMSILLSKLIKKLQILFP